MSERVEPLTAEEVKQLRDSRRRGLFLPSETRITIIDALLATLERDEQTIAILDSAVSAGHEAVLRMAEQRDAARAAAPQPSALRAAAQAVDDGWFVVDEGRTEVRLRYASDLPARLNALRAALTKADQ